MLSQNIQNRVDLLFADLIRKDSDSLRQPAEISGFIFEQISSLCESLSLKDVQERVQILCDRWSAAALAPEKNKGGRPKKWHGQLRSIRVPDYLADDLLAIALVLQQRTTQPSLSPSELFQQ